MSLNKRITQIARQSIKYYIDTQSTITQNNVTNLSNLTGQIISFDQGSLLYTVQFPDGSTQQVSPGGPRPLGVGDGVIISNGAIIG